MTELKVGDRVTVERQYKEHDGKDLEIGAIDTPGGYHIGPVGHDRHRLHDADRGSLFYLERSVTKLEAVDGPAHYGGKDNPYEAIKVAEAWGFNKEAYLFNALKYLARAGKKGNKVEDLKKLVFYVQREIALEEASGN